jgi:hypothetical protein
MKRIVPALLGTACLAILGSSAAAASAAVFTTTSQPCSGGTNVALCYENASKERLLLTGTQSVAISGGVAKFTIKTEPAQEIECTSSTGSGTISQKEPLTHGAKTTVRAFFTYRGCKLVHGPSGCKVKAELESKELGGSFETEKEVKFQPAAGAVIIEYEYSGSACGWRGLHGLTGTVKAEVLNPATAELTKTAKTFGESLEYLSSKASLATELTVAFTGLNQKVYVSKEA